MRLDLYIVLAGVIAGLVSALLFRWASARMPRVDLWTPAANLARSLVVDAANANFVAQYVQLLKLLARYLGRQVLTLALPVGAVAAVAMLLLPALVEDSKPNPNSAETVARSEGPVGNIEMPTLAEPGASDSPSPVVLVRDDATPLRPENPTTDPFAENIVPVVALEQDSDNKTSERTAPRLLPPASEEQRLLPLGLKESDVAFFVALCVGSAFGAILPLKKK